MATGGAGGSSGALLEALVDREFASIYLEIAARDMAVADDPATAREDLAAGFMTLALRRVEAELGRLVKAELTDDVKLRIRELSEQRARLKDATRAGGESGPASH